MTEIDIDIYRGPVRVLPVPVTAVDVLLINGPCELAGFSFRDASGDIGLANEGNQTSPGALASIVSITGLPAGTFTYAWSVGLEGTLAAADANNFVLQHSGVTVLQSANGFAPGEYPQVGGEIAVASGDNMIVKSIAAGTVGAIYSAQLTLTPLSLTESVAELQDGNNALAEMALGALGADSRWYGSGGLKVRNRINLHVISGAVTGAVYARFDKLTG